MRKELLTRGMKIAEKIKEVTKENKEKTDDKKKVCAYQNISKEGAE